MTIPIQFRRGTIAEWETANPILREAELGFVLSTDPDTQLMKIGDGETAWLDLPWALRGPRGFDFQYMWDGTTLHVKTSDQGEYQAVDIGIYFSWNGTQLGIKRGTDTDYSYVDLSLYFNWDGSCLGIKRGMDEVYSYTNLGLQFNWDGYELGVKTPQDAEYSYVNIRGASFEFNWDGTQLGVKTSDQLEYTYVNLKGEKGGTGDPGILTEGKTWVGNSSGVAEEKTFTNIYYGTNSPPDISSVPNGSLFVQYSA